ncbi:hypothetical protein F5050DRAFT_1806014 [Lentinula boryana]|uniref:Uncharacterized protein n=1 Tax=Lentinula boryana TaxID=40481 RepID=A0ABQ8QIQ2_9AGAR|nr:hypothetical protein F5050DRAFT_1806014 [Lentinula boryana]
MLTATKGHRYNLWTHCASDSTVNIGESFIPDSTNTPPLARPMSHDTLAVSPGCVSPTISGRVLADPQGHASGTTALLLFSEVVSGHQSSDSVAPQSEVPADPGLQFTMGAMGAVVPHATNVSSTQEANDNLSSKSILTNEQENLVNIAISQMSDEDIMRIRTCTAKVHISEDDNASSISQDTVEPKDKGKAINPRNWGNVEIDESEMDPEIQKAILTEYNAAWDAKRIDKSTPERSKEMYSPVHQTTLVEKTNDIEAPRIGRPVDQVASSLQPMCGTSKAITDQLEAQLGHIVNGKNCAEKGTKIVETKRTRLTKPSEQIAPGSHLDCILSRASAKGKHPGYPADNDDNLSSESDSSTENDHGTGGCKNRHCKLNIKSDPPEKYNGTPNVQTFLKFSTEVTEYLQDANIHHSQWVF